MKKRFFFGIAHAMIGAAVSLIGQAASAQAFPVKPVRIIVPAPPGGGTDFLSRLVGAKLTERWGQPVVIENVVGANGNIGSAQAARAPADGYTLLMSYVGAYSINPALYKTMPYDPADLEPVAKIATYPFVIAVNTALPVHSIGELVEYARANPGKLNFGSSGIGSGGHLVGEMFNKNNGTRIMHVAYRGSSPAITDLAAGQVQVTFDTLVATGPFIQSGKIRPLAVTSQTRLQSHPDIPTVVEQGFPSMVVDGWYGLFLQRNTPPEVVSVVSEHLDTIMRTQEFQEKVDGMGYVPAPPNSPGEFKDYVQGEARRWSDIAKESGATAE